MNKSLKHCLLVFAAIILSSCGMKNDVAELQHQNEILSARVQELEERNASLEERIEDLEDDLEGVISFLGNEMGY